MYEIVNKADAEEQEREYLKKSLLFDFEAGCFQLVEGSPVLSEDENTLINQWLQWLIKTVPAKYKMFSNGFGVDTDSIVGGRLMERAVEIGMIESGIRENLDKCPVISDITGFTATQSSNELKIYFEIITVSGGRKGVDLVI